MDHQDLAPKGLPGKLEDGSPTWTWIGGGLCFVFVLALLFAMSGGNKTQMAFAPLAYDQMITPPITQPAP
jgi:hypothetical protein